MMREVVIVGGGFAGARLAKILAGWGGGQRLGVHITLIDKSRYHTFQPFLYEVATAHLTEPYGEGPSPLDFFELKSSAIYPLEDIFLDNLNVTVLEDEVLGVDFKKKTVKLKKNPEGINYEILVLAAGSDTNYFGNTGLSERALPLKNFFDALAVRNAVDEAFAATPKNKKVRIAIGGGGFSGCELAGEFAVFLPKLASIHGRPKNSYECVVVEAADTVLGSASPWLQRRALERLKKLGIKFRFKSPIKDVLKNEILLQSGEKTPFDVLVWTAGVKASSITSALIGVKLEKASCIMIDKNMRILPHKNVFGAGDMTYCIDELTGKSLPMTASVALSQAKCVAENIKRVLLKKSPLDCSPRHGGFLIPLGGKYALLEFHSFRMSGVIPWFLKYLVALRYWASLVGIWKAIDIVGAGFKVYSKND